MSRTGISTSPLHYGKAPSWLFSRMTALAREITRAIVEDSGPTSLLEKLSDPYWFQSLGCVLGFDWHSSGLTTTVTGALKEGLKGMEGELGLFMAGGKGSTSRKTPFHIEEYGEKFTIDPSPFVYASKMSAKVDNTAVQDGYQLYHHVFIFTQAGEWAVVQQGMNETNKMARRYHWLGSSVKEFVVEPHQAVCCDVRKDIELNMVAEESDAARLSTTEIAREHPDSVISEIQKIRELELPKRHNVANIDIDPKKMGRILEKTYERQPEDFETLLGMKGVGPKTIRALSFVSEIIYGNTPSYRDPARFSFAHGGKDGTPYPVDRKTYDKTVAIIKRAITASKIGHKAQMDAIRRLATRFEI